MGQAYGPKYDKAVACLAKDPVWIPLPEARLVSTRPDPVIAVTPVLPQDVPVNEKPELKAHSAPRVIQRSYDGGDGSDGSGDDGAGPGFEPASVPPKRLL